jgi:hypothetical protein
MNTFEIAALILGGWTVFTLPGWAVLITGRALLFEDSARRPKTYWRTQAQIYLGGLSLLYCLAVAVSFIW